MAAVAPVKAGFIKFDHGLMPFICPTISAIATVAYKLLTIIVSPETHDKLQSLNSSVNVVKGRSERVKGIEPQSKETILLEQQQHFPTLAPPNLTIDDLGIGEMELLLKDYGLGRAYQA